MKKTLCSIRALPALACVAAQVLTAGAITFTNNTLIGVNDTNYDGQAIVISNCTVTVDGVHSFADVHVLSGGVLTHSFSTNGLLTTLIDVAGEQHLLSSTNPPVLALPNVLTNTIVVTDITGTNIYALGTDYALLATNGGIALTYVAGSSIPDGGVILVNYEAIGPSVNSGLSLVVSNSVQIAVGGAIDASGKGYGPGRGPGAGGTASSQSPYPYSAGGGGGFGGLGGPSSNQAFGGSGYGTIDSPNSINKGSGGGAGSGSGGAGGGGINLTIGGLLRVDGLIAANGASGPGLNSGGGSGGGIQLTAQTFSGAGSISAEGGSGDLYDGGGGGGGRIQIYIGTNQFTGSLAAQGGAGATYGGAGTIYTQANGNSARQIIIDNAGTRGAQTTWAGSNNPNSGRDLQVSGGAVLAVNLGGAVYLNSLTIGSNASFTFRTNTVSALLLSLTSNALIQAGGSITLDGEGYLEGPGMGGTLTTIHYGTTGGGGGNGGPGGPSLGGAPGGKNYDSVSQPTSPGSAGGSGGSGGFEHFGGFGGGAIQMSVGGTLTLNGSFTANGAAGSYPGSGGGAGGSIMLTARTMAGNGVLSANGGEGDPQFGGGGGGGGIAIYFASNQFTGTVSAYGGSGANYGGAGTIYYASEGHGEPQLVLDNGGQSGPGTTLGSLASDGSKFDLTITGGAGAVAVGQSPGGTLDNLLITSTSWLSFSNTSGSVANLIVAGNAIIGAGGAIVLDGMGSPGGAGLGAGHSSSFVGGGGGYGGYGGPGGTNLAIGGTYYGSMTQPATAGSGGGAGGGNPSLGGAGGGALQMSVSGLLELDGAITANGSAGVGSASGGGSGGSLWLTAGVLSGAGTISANGGAGDVPLGGGGGGGRIALYYGTNLFTGSVAVRGGPGAYNGGAGTIYYKGSNAVGQVLVDNAGATGQGTAIANPGFPFNLTISGGAMAVLTPSQFSATTTLGNLLVATNSSLLVSNVNALSATLSVTGNAAIQGGGSVTVDGQGTLRVEPGQGQSSNLGAGGGGYGGDGGAGGTNQTAGGVAHGSATRPNTIGSPGGSSFEFQTSVGGAGGGALQMNVAGTLALDGVLSANGLPGTAQGNGGGSGGSVWLSVGQLMGAGSIAANGGAGDTPFGGGGGGGRIAIYYSTNLFNGSVSAHGGSGANFGGAGTIYYTPNNGLPIVSRDIPQLIVDNGGAATSAFTPLSELGLQRFDLTISGGASAATGLGNFGGSPVNLLIASNSWLLFTNTASGYGLIVSSNLTIQGGSGILLDGSGYAADQGPGAGSTIGGNGAGHGGSGGAGATNQYAGGTTYDSISAPITAGSGGGGPNFFGNPSASAGSGGGALELTVGGTMALDGKISANGTAGLALRSGGGSGGSLWLSAGLLSGAGSISANGGAGDPLLGGGGGGGRIAIYSNTNLFTGSVTAYGGAGANFGGAGTIYMAPYRAGNSRVSVIVDNGGSRGTNTPLSLPLSSAFDLTISGGAVASCPDGEIIGNLLVNSNAWLGPLANLYSQNIRLTVTNTATIQAGGGIVFDGQGFAAGSGPGEGNWNSSTYGNTGGGGGYGGAGGASIGGASGGNANGSLLPPFALGSGGGGRPDVAGGAGGGAFQLNVSNALVLNGLISANGANAYGDGTGGGSGGGIWLNGGSLSGTGVISANGGAGDYYYGGGGGGGRIAITTTSNAFAGTISARGGAGTVFGGAGTVYLQTNGAGAGQVIVDNGGVAGATTPLSITQSFNLTVSGAAIIYPSNGSFILSSLAVGSGASIVGGIDRSNVFNPGYTITMTVLGNATVGTNSAISTESQGYSGNYGGPGAGLMPTNSGGSGGGYGGAGGSNATGTPGGPAYGSATQPTNWGSSGGLNLVYPNLSQGGGAIRMMVGGSLSVNGSISSDGDSAFFPGAGGGAGGSVWITAREVDGSGNIRANGGLGYPAQGGGGGGGRVALYSRTNNFAGAITALGGAGAFAGQNGTVVTNSIPLPQVIFQSPTDVVYYAVSNVALQFGSPMNFASVSGANIIVDTPIGELPSGSIGVSGNGLYSLAINFPAQNTIGFYDFQVGPQIQDIYGLPLSPTYVGSFVILPPIISGQITDTNGQPVAYVTLRPSGGLAPVLTDTNGLYTAEVLPSWTGVITPSKGEAMFIPTSRSYSNVTGDITNQNYVLASPAVLALTGQRQGTNMNLGWFGINGVTYQPLYSTDLVNWFPCGAPQTGTNGMMQGQMPIDSQPAMFFRFSTSYGFDDPRFQRLVKEQIAPANH